MPQGRAMWRYAKRVSLMALALLLCGLLLPEQLIIPVRGATLRDWNRMSFWFEPWGVSGVHKGIDIFAPKGRPVVASVSGLVVYTGELAQGGKVVAVLGPKWRIHYFAHLDSWSTSSWKWAEQGDVIGTVGTSGNAVGKPAHLHFSVISLLPLPWRFTEQTQGWKRMFYLDPDMLLRKGTT
jgi:peptidoglycan LD-endopeptidase LytH